MKEKDAVDTRPLSNADLARVLSPLLLFGAHLAYLVLWSPDPFLMKWIDGSFTFFLALVLCNIIRARTVAASAPSAADDDAGAAEANAGPSGGGDSGEGRGAGTEHFPG